jgi:hypothetical protein
MGLSKLRGETSIMHMQEHGHSNSESIIQVKLTRSSGGTNQLMVKANMSGCDMTMVRKLLLTFIRKLVFL